MLWLNSPTLLECLLHNIGPLKKKSGPKTFGSRQAEDLVLSLSGSGGRSFSYFLVFEV